MIICNRIFKVNRSSVYIVLGFFSWFCTIKSGVHATLAGFTTILCTPFRETNKDFPANFRRFNFILGLSFILPVFAFANAGITFARINFSILFEPIMLGIILGLFVGKQLSIFPILVIFKKLKLFKLANLYQIYSYMV